MSGSSPLPSSSLLTSNKLEPPLAAEMWAFLKALATQLHANMELATSSSSSTTTEPSPAQGSKRKDKAPTSLEDSNDDDKDIAKFVLGGKSLSLAQGSDALLYNIGSLKPRAESLSDLYEDIVRVVKKVSICSHCTFPPNDNAGFSKEDLLHVTALCKQFKALHTALQLCIGLVEDGCVLVDIYSVIVTILYTMRLQLDVHDDIYIKHKYGEETLSHFNILNDSNLVGECQACLLDAITLAHASAYNQSANQDSANQNHGKQSGKKKDAPPVYPPNKPN